MATVCIVLCFFAFFFFKVPPKEFFEIQVSSVNKKLSSTAAKHTSQLVVINNDL